MRGTLPLLVWAAHFAACYVFVAAQCSPLGYEIGNPQRWPLVVFTALALAVCGWLMWKWRGTLRDADERTPLLDWAAAGSALLAFVGIVWTSVPMWVIQGCR